ncbi:MAG: hypothetical protein ABI885_30890 [Gammaproteobacteria bacterium]
MGDHNSTLTRVQPVFNALLDLSPDGDSWLGELWDMAALTRPGMALSRPSTLGRLIPGETPVDHAARPGKVYERTVAPPAAFLRWLLENPHRMQVGDRATFGAKSRAAQQWRAKLFSDDAATVSQAQAEGLNQLSKRLGSRGRNKWWAFEGFTHVDCCLITDECVLFVEGKRTHGISPSTRWFTQRSQLWRNVEAAQEFAGAKEFAMILAVENEADGTTALADGSSSLAGSFPHLEPGQRTELDRHVIGFVTWAEVVTRFGLTPECLPPRVRP